MVWKIVKSEIVSAVFVLSGDPGCYVLLIFCRVCGLGKDWSGGIWGSEEFGDGFEGGSVANCE